ncbi:unnamed protein product [Nippostrongylus brasiliensis]|uniref:Nuclear pore complex protein n=1 Tax=Nippostrongylus brasiliensis TaxID=27835 RepID=A0A0N4XXD8_NIPBR|nr:unnamed protein product [Nippostrongylus brasiliensis]
MRLIKQHQKANVETVDSTFLELDKAVYEDLHSELARLSAGENELDVWSSLGRALWLWSQNCAMKSKGFSDLAYQYKDIHDPHGSGISELKRLINERKVAADPTSMLNAADDPNIDKIMRVVFSLLRCGRFEECIELLRSTCIPWMVPLVRSQLLLVEPSLLCANVTNLERTRLHYREIAYKSMADGLTEAKNTTPVRMVLAALVGDFEFLLPFATNIDDRLWCYANAAVHASLHKALGIEHPVFAPTTIGGIFEAINASEPIPYYELMSFMMRRAWDEAVDWMFEYSKRMEKEKKEAADLHRFFGLVASVCHIAEHDRNESHTTFLIGKMVDVLQQKKLFNLIPFYAALLPNEVSLQRIWNVMPCIDGETLAVEFGRFRVVENVDHSECLRWIFACGDKKLVHAIAEANAILRFYLLEGLEKEAAALIAECERLKLVDRLSALVKAEKNQTTSDVEETAAVVIDEFNNYCLYFSAQAHCNNFALECSRAHQVARQKAEDERECEEWALQSDMMGLSQRRTRRTLDAVQAFIRHPGWRPEQEEDWSRAEQLKALRERLYARILKILIHNLQMCDDTAAAMDVLVMMADDDVKLYEDLTKDDLSDLLLQIHSFAGHTLTDKNGSGGSSAEDEKPEPPFLFPHGYFDSAKLKPFDAIYLNLMAQSNLEYGGITLEELDKLDAIRKLVARPKSLPRTREEDDVLLDRVPLPLDTDAIAPGPKDDSQPRPPRIPFSSIIGYRRAAEEDAPGSNPFEEIATRAPPRSERERLSKEERKKLREELALKTDSDEEPRLILPPVHEGGSISDSDPAQVHSSSEQPVWVRGHQQTDGVTLTYTADR